MARKVIGRLTRKDLTIRTVLDKCTVDTVGWCWNWPLLTAYGYGYVAIEGWKRAMVHRVTWEAVNGPVPMGLVIDHLCRNKACCNPDHLEPVTIVENNFRGTGCTPATKCKHGHDYTPENTIIQTRKDGRESKVCRTCRNQRFRKYRSEDPQRFKDTAKRFREKHGDRVNLKTKAWVKENREYINAYSRAKRSGESLPIRPSQVKKSAART